MDHHASFVQVLGRFIVDAPDDGMPQLARTVAARAFADTAAVAVAGAVNPIGEQILESVRTDGHPGSAGIFGGTDAVSVADALLVNGTLAHCLDFDDTNHPLYAHPSAVLVSTAAVVGGAVGASGHDLVTAYLVGHEVEVAMARAINHDHYAQGFHATGTLGVFGATATAARLLGLDAGQAAHALATAASLACGIRANIGSMTKPLHAGMAAQNGYRAARLAQQGWESSLDALERPGTGFFAAFAVGREPDVRAALDPLGQHWAITDPFGQQIKPFPSCGATHPAIEATVVLRERLTGSTDPLETVGFIQSVDVAVCELLPGILVYDDPQTSHEGRFSLPYTVATALVDGRVTLGSFTDEMLHRATVRRLMDRVTYRVDERVRDSSEFAAVVSVHTADGAVLEERSDFALGKNAKPMSEDQLLDKVRGCLEFAGAADEDVERVWTAWRGIDESHDTRQMWASVRQLWKTARRPLTLGDDA